MSKGSSSRGEPTAPVRSHPKPAPHKKKRRWKSPRCVVRGCKRAAEVIIPGSANGRPMDSESVYERSSRSPGAIPASASGRPSDFESEDARSSRAAGTFCRSHAKAEADRKWSLLVRSKGICELAALHRDRFPCGGVLQAAHGFSRRYRATRHDLINGFCICAASHRYWGMKPLEWDEILRKQWGELVYEELRRKALAG